MSGSPSPRRRAGRTSIAIDNLRAWVILLVVAFHSSLAYLAFLPAHPFAFDRPPFQWRAFAIVGPHRSVALELFCAWQDIFLMTLFFLLSGLFFWPSLGRRGRPALIADRMRRLGMPFLLVVALLMPVAHYPTYLQTAAVPGIGAYIRAFLALPLWPSGPMWFLWLLLSADLLAIGLSVLVPNWGERLACLSATAGVRPVRYFLWLSVASALAYVPLAIAFTPQAWGQVGPFSLQLSRPLHYAVYFFAGAGLGAYGIERGLFGPEGPLVKYWRIWLALALGSFVLWLGITALVVEGHDQAAAGVRIIDDLSFVVACLCNTFGVLALALRFAAGRRTWLENLKENTYGIYLVHYVFVVWLQFALLPADLPGIVKAATVFAGSVSLSWAATAASRYLRAFAVSSMAGGRWMAAKPS